MYVALECVYDGECSGFATGRALERVGRIDRHRIGSWKRTGVTLHQKRNANQCCGWGGRRAKARTAVPSSEPAAPGPAAAAHESRVGGSKLVCAHVISRGVVLPQQLGGGGLCEFKQGAWPRLCSRWWTRTATASRKAQRPTTGHDSENSTLGVLRRAVVRLVSGQRGAAIESVFLESRP